MDARLTYQVGKRHGMIIMGSELSKDDAAQLRKLANAALRAGAFDVDEMPGPDADVRYQLWIKDGPVPLCEDRTFGKDMAPDAWKVIDWILDHGDPRRICQ